MKSVFGEVVSATVATIAGIILVICGLWGAASILLPLMLAGTELSTERSNRGAAFAASNKSALVLIRVAKDDWQPLLLDLQTGKQRRLTSTGAQLRSPSLSTDGERLLLVRHPKNNSGSELLSCDTDRLSCKLLVKKVDTAIHSPIELSNGRVLYIASPLHTGGDGRKRYSRHDVWLLEPQSGPRQLTDLQLYQMSTISVTRNEIYFSAFGSPPQRPFIPRGDPSAPEASSIFRLPFDPAEGEVTAPTRLLEPLFVAPGIARALVASPDGSQMAFLRTTSLGNYRFDLVIADMRSGKEHTITSVGMGYSTPVIVGNDVLAVDIIEGRSVIRMVTGGERDSKIVADIVDKAAANAEVVELAIPR